MNLTCYVVDDEYHSVEMLIEYIDKTDGLELQGFSTNPLTALNEVTGPNPPDITFLEWKCRNSPEWSSRGWLSFTQL